MQNQAIRDQIKEIFSVYWKDFKDPRSSRNQKHLFVEILFAAFCAMLCNANGWSEMETFSDEFLDFLREFFPYENGAPSDDTFRRVLSVLNPEHFQATFRKCMEPIIPLLAEKKFAIDGKVSRGSVQIINQGKQSLNIVSVVAAESGLVLTREKVANKSNEITAIPTLLESLDLKNATITIDAMGCQYKIADQIVRGGGNYVLALKGNQENLLEAVKLIFATEGIHQKCNFFETEEKGCGRKEIRGRHIFTDISELRAKHPKWETVRAIVRLDSKREIKGKNEEETRY
ncbi:MAG: ISAs1 family transposase, partial [Holosporaceae bacterium]|nr:ISAs1 family transposase [Holosporaceae bacterium]